MADGLRLRTAARPLDAIVRVPGSKSIANRALVCAALADGDSELVGVPDGDDTAAMVDGLRAIGVEVRVDGGVATVAGTGGALPAGTARIHARLAGTTSRFLTAVAALAPGPVTIDGDPPLRKRPMGPLHDALLALGAEVRRGEARGHLPVTVRGPLHDGGRLTMPGDVSSQYLTALMLIAPLLRGGLHVELATPLVSRPYVELTAAVMAAFGAGRAVVDDDEVVVAADRYRGVAYAIEPDASSASYALALAAVAGGRVGVEGLRAASAQGDVVFADLLRMMGCDVDDTGSGLVVARRPDTPLRGIDVDLGDVSDLVPTLAAVAATASTPTTITGVGFIRTKESDRLGDLAAELTKTGAAVTEERDGLRIEPADHLHGAVLSTHHDHRLAMAFGVLGAAVPGIEVRHPDVVSKSWPDYWNVRDQVVAGR